MSGFCEWQRRLSATLAGVVWASFLEAVTGGWVLKVKAFCTCCWYCAPITAYLLFSGCAKEVGSTTDARSQSGGKRREKIRNLHLNFKWEHQFLRVWSHLTKLMIHSVHSSIMTQTRNQKYLSPCWVGGTMSQWSYSSLEKSAFLDACWPCFHGGHLSR